MKIQKQTYKQIQITNGFMPLKKKKIKKKDNKQMYR